MPVIRNKRTGEQMWVPDQGPQMPANPEYPYKGPQAAAGVASTQTNTQRTAQQMQQDAELFPVQKQLAEVNSQLAAVKLADAQRAQQLAQQEADAKNPFNPDRLQSVEQDAMRQLQAVSRIGQNYNNATLPAIGLGADTVKNWFGGTAANNIAADQEVLQSGGAMNRIMQMSADNGGKNPLTPMSNSDVQMLAKGVGNLDQSQSPDNYFANLNSYAEPAKRAYAGAVGMKTLDAELKRLGIDKFPPAMQARIRADALKRHQANMQQPRSSTRNAPRVDRNNDGIPDDVRGILGKYGVR